MEASAFLEHQENDTQNIVRVKELYTALNSGDRVLLAKLLSDNPTWSVCPGFPDGGTYIGMAEVFGAFYPTLLSRIHGLRADPDVFIDGGDIVTVLGFYRAVIRETAPAISIRFSHTWKIAPDGLFEGVWQVADSSIIRECLKAD